MAVGGTLPDMGWREEHGEDYDVPEQITKIEGVRDLSWHNDVAPSFGVEDDDVSVRLWAEHPDEDRREYPGPRFNITTQGWTPQGHDAIYAAHGWDSSPGGQEDWPVWEGDDPDEAARQLVTHVSNVRQQLHLQRRQGRTARNDEFKHGRFM